MRRDSLGGGEAGLVGARSKQLSDAGQEIADPVRLCQHHVDADVQSETLLGVLVHRRWDY
jgi:hypothetical protein